MPFIKVEHLTLFILLYNILHNEKNVKCTKVKIDAKFLTENLTNPLTGPNCRHPSINDTMLDEDNIKTFENCVQEISDQQKTFFDVFFINFKNILSGNNFENKKVLPRNDDINYFENTKKSSHHNMSNSSVNILINESRYYNEYTYSSSESTISSFLNKSIIEIDYLPQTLHLEEKLKTLQRDFGLKSYTAKTMSWTNDDIIHSNRPNNPLSGNSTTEVYLNETAQGHDPLISVFKSRYPVDSWYQFGFFTEDYLRSINRHWLQFEPPDKVSHYALAALYVVVMTIGIGGNCLVIFMYARCRSLRVPANTLVINLAISDFIMLVKMPIFIFNSFYFGPVLGEPGCQLYGFLGGLTGTVSITTLAAIALDRYYAVVYPLDPLRKTTHLRARFSVVFVWTYGCVFAGLPLTKLGLNRYVPEGYLTSCSFDYLTTDINSRVFIFVFFIAAWLLPFTIITISYFGIFLEVIKAGSAAPCRHGQEAEKRRLEVRLASMVIGVIALWFVAWTPYAIVALLGIFGFHNLISPLGSMIPALFCKFASCIDPYVYAFTHPKFRREINRLFLPNRNRTSQRYQSQMKPHTYTSRTSFQLKHAQEVEGHANVELDEITINVKQKPWTKTLLLNNTFIPTVHNKSNKISNSLQNSIKYSSNDYTLPNSSPF